MSIGNLKDYGNKGNNFPFQLKVLRGFTELMTMFSQVITVIVQPIPKTTTIARPTSAGTVVAGWNSVSIANVGTANGTVKGVTLKPGETVSFDGGAVNNTLDAIAYVATGTEFLIITVG
jgi:hypothetical protein